MAEKNEKSKKEKRRSEKGEIRRKEQEKSVSTGGGAYVVGNVNTGRGDFVGRDKKVSGTGGLVVGGSLQAGVLHTGSGNAIGTVQNLFAPVYRAIEQSSLSAQARTDLVVDVQEIESEIVKAEEANESFLARRLRNLKRMAPEIGELLLSALAGPGAVVSSLVKTVAEKVKKEA